MPELQNNNNELFLNPSMDEEEQIPTTKELDANIYNKIDENLRLVIDCYIANAYPGSHTFIHFYRHDDENKKTYIRMPKEIFPYYIGSFYEAFSKIPELRNLFLAGQNDDEFLDIDGVRWKIIQIDSLKESLLNYELDVQDILRLMGCDSQADDYLAAFEYKLAESNSEYKTDEQQKTEEQTISISEEIDAQTSIKSQKVEEPTIAEHKNANGNRLEGFFLGIGIFIGLVTAIIIEQTRSKTLSIISVFASLFFYFFSFFTIYFVSVKLNDCYQKRDKNDKKVSTYNKATILIIIIWISFALLVLSCLQ